ncbi:anhydro-N-acetylmuramic acid kinase [Roseomonas gilardii]|uniref:anhydro-N-acetylmuramic acid kinase n=1 Tax=Roseomonas gilardii TaxID=257708 RepID=UPI0004893D12|nr:anhydro-N-acetylmuramic acid kinase [Roseomonas gilardii]SUE45060.1 Anhydro-N-acetylmuramic acid kinase [Roseomonas gilardii subsp. rosea]
MPSHPAAIAIGVISGTSVDGIDVAAIRSDGDALVEPGEGRTYPYEPGLRAALLELAAQPDQVLRDPLTALEQAVTESHAAAVERFLAETGLPREEVAVVGLHGQTVLHRPEARFTRQLVFGDAAAARLGLPVVDRFRDADVAAGGQGAPLVPLYHRALAAELGEAGPLAVLNLGGVGNVTYLDGDTVIAFDTGPANAMLDDFLFRRTGRGFDEGGRLARSGQADAAIVARFLENPFFGRPVPKSLDRNAFAATLGWVAALSDADGAATLAACTVEAQAAALRHLPRPPRRWLVAGGGRHNAVLMDGLRQRLGVPVEAVETVGWNGDFLEAQCFGFLALRSLRGLPLSLPSTTGAPAPMPGGRHHPAPGRPLPA